MGLTRAEKHNRMMDRVFERNKELTEKYHPGFESTLHGLKPKSKALKKAKK